MAKNDFQYGDGILTPCNVARSWHLFCQVTAHCNVACGSGIATVDSPSGSTLQCDTSLCDDMPLNLPKRPPYWNSTSGFDFDHDFDHIIAVDMPFCTISEILSKSDQRRQKTRSSAIADKPCDAGLSGLFVRIRRQEVHVHMLQTVN